MVGEEPSEKVIGIRWRLEVEHGGGWQQAPERGKVHQT